MTIVQDQLDPTGLDPSGLDPSDPYLQKGVIFPRLTPETRGIRRGGCANT
jgi:hypothetical protein